MRRHARVATCVALVVVCASSLTACNNKNKDLKRSLQAAINATLRSPRTLTYVDQDLVTTSTVTGTVQDDDRYRLLLSNQDGPIWQQVAVDDAIADYFPTPSAISTYAGAGSSPALDALTTFKAVRSSVPDGIAKLGDNVFASKLPKSTALSNSLALASLRARKWVVDPTGAPPAPNPDSMDATKRTLSNPFFEAQTALARAADIVDETPFYKIRLYEAGDLTPTFKRTDDPFPAPAAGVKRYDIAQEDLPKPGLNTSNGVPLPPDAGLFRKVAIYVQDGRVIAVRINQDVLDRLNDISQLYKIPLHLSKSVGVQVEEQLGQLTVDLLQSAKEVVPFRVQQETLLLSFPATSPRVELPTPAVTASLTLLPGQGAQATKATSS